MKVGDLVKSHSHITTKANSMKITIYGTSYFPTKRDANNYFLPYGFSSEDVSIKISEGSIHIGSPPLRSKLTDQLKLVYEKPGYRYHIVSKSC